MLTRMHARTRNWNHKDLGYNSERAAIDTPKAQCKLLDMADASGCAGSVHATDVSIGCLNLRPHVISAKMWFKQG